jgi:hypothetical protein
MVGFEDPKPPSGLGFCQPPGERFLFIVATKEGYPWTFSKDEPCKEKALCGYLKGLKFADAEFKGAPVVKLQILLDAGEDFVIQSGVTSIFSRGFALCLNLLADECYDFSTRPVYLSPKVSDGKDSDVVFNRLLRDDGSSVFAEWNKDIDPLSLLKRLNVRLFSAEAEAQKKIATFRTLKDFNAPSVPAVPEPVKFQALVAELTDIRSQLGYSKEQVKLLISQRYSNKAFNQLDDLEVMDLLKHLKSLLVPPDYDPDVPF